MKLLLKYSVSLLMKILFIFVSFFVFQNNILAVSVSNVNSGFDPHNTISENYTYDEIESLAWGKSGRIGRIIWVELKSEVGSACDILIGESSVAAKSSNLWKVGSYKNLRGVEAGLDAHHVGQKALMKRFVPGYNASTAPSILVPKLGHTVGKGVVSRSTSGLTNARQVLARDIFELRRVYGSQGIPNSSLQQLIQMNKQMYPEAFIK